MSARPLLSRLRALVARACRLLRRTARARAAPGARRVAPGEFPRPAEVEFRDSVTMRRAARWYSRRVLDAIRSEPFPVVGERRPRP